MSLNSGLKNKHYIRIEKSDWSGTLGDFIPLQDSTEKVINLIAHNELDDTYPAVRVGRADADHDGNDIPTTYLKKADAKTIPDCLSDFPLIINSIPPVVSLNPTYCSFISVNDTFAS